LAGSQASDYLNAVLMPLCTVWPSRNLYVTALTIREETGFSFCDALIVAGALDCDNAFSNADHYFYGDLERALCH